VSKNVQPRSAARLTALRETASFVGPYEFPCSFPPIAHPPKPISETLRPVRPSVRTRIASGTGPPPRTLRESLSAPGRSRQRMIEGERVRIRKLERSDLAHLHRWLNDADLMAWARFAPDHMESLAAVEKEYERELAGEERDRTTFTVEDRASGKAIGWCVMRTWDRKHVSTNVGIGLGEKEFWGRGYGTEAMRLLLTIAFDHQGWHRAELWTLADNERAVRSFEKSGFRREGLEREAAYYGGAYHDILLMAQLKSEWDARKA